jgi:hypothetical protein
LLIPVLLIVAGIALWRYHPQLRKQKTVSMSGSTEQLHLLEPRSYFIENEEAGQLFVIEGRLRNEYPAPRRQIYLRAKLYTVDGRVVQQLDFYAGHPLSAQQLQGKPLAALHKLIQQHPSTEKGERIVASHQEVSFAVPFGNLPELTSLSDYSVEILASQPT